MKIEHDSILLVASAAVIVGIVIVVILYSAGLWPVQIPCDVPC